MGADGPGPMRRFLDEIDPVVFLFGAGLTLSFIILFAISPDYAATVLWGINDRMLAYFNWMILGVMLSLVAFLLFLIVGPWGKIKFGDEPPEYSFLSFFSMLYSAGFAAGVVFWGPTEALLLYTDPSPLYGAAPESSEAMVRGVQYSIFHWSVTQLACFTLLGIAIGYFAYNYENVPLRVSSLLTPIIGVDRLDGPIAKLVDIVAVFATLGGVATSLGFIGSQFVTGLEFQWGLNFGSLGIIAVVTVMTLLFTLSLVLGVDRGIRRLSNFNMGLFGLLMLATFIVGPTTFLLVLGTQAVGGLLNDFTAMSLYTGAAAGNGSEWSNGWTVFYWAWALSWSPFAGLFIARISRGRTVREVAFTGIIATSLATIPWFVIIGGTAVWTQHTGVAQLLGPVDSWGPEVSGFVLFEVFPFGTVLMLAFLTLVTTFFVTSADSSTLAVSMMTTGGKASPSSINRIFWGLMLGLTASILMIISEGTVEALQAAAVITGGPFAIVAFIAMLGLIKEFSSRYGRVLLQDETTLIGSRSDRQSSLGDQAEVADDD
ncbi:BCCT family transporter (plasmid) [Haloferacaceae archaeon DSL9]